MTHHRAGLLTSREGYAVKDYMKRKTLTQDNGWSGPWRDIDLCGRGHNKRINNEKRKHKRRARHNMKQQLNRELREYM